MKKIVQSIAVAALTLAMTACSTRVADLTVASTKNLNFQSDALVLGNRVQGSDGAHLILFIPTGQPQVKEAVDNAIEQDRCVVGLADAVMNYDFFLIPILGGSFAYTVEGTQIIDKNIRGCENWSPSAQRSFEPLKDPVIKKQELSVYPSRTAR